MTEEQAINLVVGDITQIPADAIVNAANSALAGGGGVDGAIHRAGGPAIMADLEHRYGRGRHCPTGSAVVSLAGNLPALGRDMQVLTQRLEELEKKLDELEKKKE